MLKRDVHLRPLAALLVAAAVLLLPSALASAQTAAKADTAKAARPARAAKPAKPKISRADDIKKNGLWAGGTNWISLRAGYAKLTTETSADGFVGYGVAYQRNLTSKYGFVASVHHEIIGAANVSKEISVPMTAGFVRHLDWRTALRPYVGLGAGYYFHKYYRSGLDYGGAPASGWYLNGGWNIPLSDRNLFGMDARVSFVDGRGGVQNPVFGSENENETQWSVKLNWSLGY